MEKELWDACDREGNLLGFDLVRGEPIPEGAWYRVAAILPVTEDGRVLVTKRHPQKHWGGYWECSGGAVVKGETPLQAAFRELREETGVAVSRLYPAYIEAQDVRQGVDPAVFYTYLAVFRPEEQTIRLQEGETVDYRLLPYEAFKRFMQTDEFVPSVRQRILRHQELFDRMVAEHTAKR